MTLVADVVYLLALILLGPFYWLWRRSRKKTGIPFTQRLGSGLRRREGSEPLVWLHAVSVGEVTALGGLLARLRELRPDARFLVTTTTASGLAVARQAFPAHAVHPSPLDLSFCVRRYFEAFRPSVLVLVEAELWPNLIGIAGRRGVPVFVVNARVSDRSFLRYRMLTRLWPGFLRPIRRFLVQAPEHGARLAGLGIGPERVSVAGNVKFDNAAIEDPSALRRELRTAAGIPSDAPVVVAGSTHPGEEGDVARAFLRCRADFPSAVLILAPRHLERLGEVRALLDGVGLRTMRWSERTPVGSAPCILVDTIGELGRLYAAADVAFVGGSLSPIGGHNLLEPARFGIPMVTGPHLGSVRSLATSFEQSGALAIVRDPDGLARVVSACFSDRIGAAGRGRRAQATIASNQGAARRCADVLAEALGGPSQERTNHD